MNKRSLVVPTIFLQAVVVLTGIGALTFLLWEPQIEGRNLHATVFEIYFHDPFLAYVYFASIPFFMAVYQTFNLLRYIRMNQACSETTAKSLRTIKYCALATIGLAAIAEVLIFMGESDDRAGGVFMGVLVTFGAAITASVSSIVERILQNAVES